MKEWISLCETRGDGLSKRRKKQKKEKEMQVGVEEREPFQGADSGE